MIQYKYNGLIHNAVYVCVGRQRRRWEDNIKMDLQEVGGGVMPKSSWLRIWTGGGHL